MPEDDVLSTINFSRVTEKVDDGDDAPVSIIVNNPEGHHYYPIYVPNPLYGKWDKEELMIVAKYIQYSPNYLFVSGCNGKAYKECTIPI